MNKERRQSYDTFGIVWENTKPGFEVTKALFTPILKPVGETIVFFGRIELERYFRKR